MVVENMQKQAIARMQELIRKKNYSSFPHSSKE
jgi:hypothetical protein